MSSVQRDSATQSPQEQISSLAQSMNSVLSLQSTASGPSQKYVELSDLEELSDSGSVTISDSDLRPIPNNNSGLNEFINGQLALHSSSRTSSSHSSSSLSYRDAIESRQTFYSPIPLFEQPPSSAVNEFTRAANRWRAMESKKDAGCQTTVVMTISACVGTTTKMFVDASTNTELSHGGGNSRVDVGIDTKDLAASDGEQLRHGIAEPMGVSTAVRTPVTLEKFDGSFTKLKKSGSKLRDHHSKVIATPPVDVCQSVVHGCSLSSTRQPDQPQSSDALISGCDSASETSPGSNLKWLSGKKSYIPPPPGLHLKVRLVWYM